MTALEKPTYRDQLTYEWKHIVVTALCFAISLGWIWVVGRYSIYKTADAGRGGAIGVATSFAMFFGRRNYPKLIYSTHEKIKELTAKLAELAQLNAPSSCIESDIADLKEQVALVESYFAVNAGSQSFQNILLTISSVTGTLAWGWGDWLADQMRAYCRF